MTTLRKPIRRTVPTRGKKLVLTVTPLPEHDAILEIREARRHEGYSITLSGLHTLLALRAANLSIERHAKRGQR